MRTVLMAHREPSPHIKLFDTPLLGQYCGVPAGVVVVVVTAASANVTPVMEQSKKVTNRAYYIN